MLRLQRQTFDGIRCSLLFEPEILLSFFFSWSNIYVLTGGQRGPPRPCSLPRDSRCPVAPRHPKLAPLVHLTAVLTTARVCARVTLHSQTPRRLVPSSRVTEQSTGTGRVSTSSEAVGSEAPGLRGGSPRPHQPQRCCKASCARPGPGPGAARVLFPSVALPWQSGRLGVS